MKKIILSLITSLLFVTGSVFAAGNIIVVTHGQANDPFWSIVKKGVDTAARNARAKAQYRAPATFDMSEMAKLIDAAVAQKPDGIIVSIPDADALGDSIRRAVAAGIPVISINSGSDVYKKLGVQAHVGQTEYEAGLGGGEKMKAAGVKNALCINHEVGNVALDLRCEGFQKGLGGKVRIVATSNDPTAVRTAVTAALKRDRNVDGILTLGPLSAEPTLAALKELDRVGKLQFGSFDLADSTLEATARGEMSFLIDQQPYLQGYLPVVALAQYAEWGVLPSGLVLTGPGFVTQDNARAVIAAAKKGYR